MEIQINDHPKLTIAQCDVLYLLSTGMSYKQIANRKMVKRSTVWRHAQMARERLGAKTIIEAVAIYILTLEKC